jgi:hypothetical protein
MQTPSVQHEIRRSWASIGARFLLFADAATPDLPLSRLLRLSLCQVSVGMTTTSSTAALAAGGLPDVGFALRILSRGADPLRLAVVGAALGLLVRGKSLSGDLGNNTQA